jgi:hypothetical protein
MGSVERICGHYLADSDVRVLRQVLHFNICRLGNGRKGQEVWGLGVG